MADGQTSPGAVLLFHERSPRRSGKFDASDEEECFTAVGRRSGVWLTTEPLVGPTVVSGEVSVQLLAPFEVTGDGDAHRAYVVPALTCGSWIFG